MARRVLLVEDHDLFVEGLQRILADQPRYRIADHARTYMEANRLLLQGRWELMIVDIGLPDGSGLDLIRRARDLNHTCPVLVLSMQMERTHVLQAFRIGANGYLTKGTSGSDFLRALDVLDGGGRYVSPELGGLLLDARLDDERPPHERLSEREFQIFRMIGEGLRTSEIAAKLHLQPSTVSTYKAKIAEKLGLERPSEIVRYIVRYGPF